MPFYPTTDKVEMVKLKQMAEGEIEEIKRKIDIVDLISSYLPLKKAGRNFKALCPFHSEKTPSFMVSQELQIFKCFGCGEGGDVFAFLKKIEGIEFAEALKLLADRAGVALKSFKPSPEVRRKERLFAVNNLASEFFHFLLVKHKIGKEVYSYLRKRGIQAEAVEKFGLGYAPRSWESLGNFILAKKFSLSDLLSSGLVVQKEKGRGFYDRFRGRLIFPLKDEQGRVVGFSGRRLTENEDEPKYINTPETPIFKKGAFLYGLHLAKTAIKREKLAIIVEGQTDVITPFQAGTENIVASLGTALTSAQIRLLARFTKDIALCFDTDLAGDAAARRGIELAEEAGLTVKVLPLPPSFKDPDEWVRKDPRAWREALGKLISVYDFIFTTVLGRYDLGKVEGKKKTLVELLSVLAKIRSAVVKDHYLKRLAEELSVEEGAVRADLERYQRLEKPENFQSQAARKTTARQESLERKVLRLPFFLPLEEAKTALRKLAARDFTDLKRATLFNLTKKYFLPRPRLAGRAAGRRRAVDASVFRDKLGDEIKPLFEEIYFSSDEPESEEELKVELEAVIEALKRETLRRELKFLGREIKKAEGGGFQRRFKRLQKKFLEVSAKLAERGSRNG